MSLFNVFSFLFLIVFFGSFSAFAESDVSCDPAVEKKLEKLNAECDARKMKAAKQWLSLDLAKTEVLLGLKTGSAETLAQYIGCDAGYSTKLEKHCESELPEISVLDLQRVMDLVKKSPSTVLSTGKWVNYGSEKDIFVYCSSDFKNVAAMNYCDKTGKFQPVIELKRIGQQYYIFGLPELK